MKIDADVDLAARYFGIDPKLIQAVVNAEGNILKAVRISVPTCKNRAQALEITCRSAVHAMSDFLKDAHVIGASVNLQRLFVEFWSRRWAPVGADNDPTSLNANWPRNVLALWTKP